MASTTTFNTTSRWNHDQLHADAHRIVGGTYNLVRELARICQELDPSASSDWITKRLTFLSYELQTEVAPDAPERQRLAALNQFLFKAKRYRCSVGNAHLLGDPSDAYRIDRVLSNRVGAGPVLSLIYAYLAEQIGIELEFVDLKPASFLKWTAPTTENPCPCYIDMTRSGAILSNDELIETLHDRFKMLSVCPSTVLEPSAFESFLSDYIRDLKKALPSSVDPDQLLFLQNTLISYNSSNLFLLAERALLHRRIGNFKSALADLKRYFAFHERDKAPSEFVSLYEELVQLLERHKSNVETLD